MFVSASFSLNHSIGEIYSWNILSNLPQGKSLQRKSSNILLSTVIVIRCPIVQSIWTLLSLQTCTINKDIGSEADEAKIMSYVFSTSWNSEQLNASYWPHYIFLHLFPLVNHFSCMEKESIETCPYLLCIFHPYGTCIYAVVGFPSVGLKWSCYSCISF